MGNVAQRSAELIADMSAVTAAAVQFIHHPALSFPCSLTPVASDGRLAVRIEAFTCESWLKGCPIRIAATTGNRPVGQRV
jgi:hypothetical protein